MKSIQLYLDILQTEPAPSPYSGVLENFKYSINGKPLKWKIFLLDPENEEDNSRIMLVDEENTPWLILNYLCHIKPIDDSKLLIWYCSSEPKTREYFISYFDISDLNPLDLEKAKKVLNEAVKDNPKDHPLRTVSHGYYAEFKKQPISFTIPNKLSQGKNKYNFPEGFTIQGENILQGYYNVNSHEYKWEYNPWINPFCILLLRTKTQEIEVICVDWFNKEEWDLDYQWISRIAKDPDTKKFVCEGIRMGVFQLDKTGKKLDKWIFKHDFYMYPSCDPLK